MNDRIPPAETTPRWVKVAGAIVLVLVLLVVVLLVTGKGDHGPGRHGSALSQATPLLEQSP